MSAPTYGFRSHYCAVSDARGRMPCGDQCDTCRAIEHAEEDEAAVEACRDGDGLKEKDMLT